MKSIAADYNRRRVDINAYLGADLILSIPFDGVDLSGYAITWEIFKDHQRKPSHTWTLADGLAIDGHTLTSNAMTRDITRELGPGIHRHHFRFSDGSTTSKLGGFVIISDAFIDRSGPPEFDFRSFNK